MKSLRLLTQQMGRWWHVNLPSAPRTERVNQSWLRVVGRARQCLGTAQVRDSLKNFQQLSQSQLMAIAATPPPKKRKPHPSRYNHPRFIFVVAVVSLTSTIGYRFYNEPELAVSTVAPQTLRAPDDARVEDTKTTDENRKAARTGAIPVLMVDVTVNQEIYQELQRAFDQGDELRSQSGPFPFVDPSVLSVNTQRFLRQINDADWQKILALIEQSSSPTTPLSLTGPGGNGSNPDLGDGSISRLALLELQNYRRTHSPEDFAVLKQSIVRVRQRYTTIVERLRPLAAVQTQSSAYFDVRLLDLTETAWNRTKTGIRQALERILTQGLPPGLPISIQEKAFKMHAAIDVPPEAIDLATRVLLDVVQPNLAEDVTQTRQRAEQAALAVDPVMVEIRRDEVIVRAGEEITQADFVLLDHFGMSRRRINWLGLVGFGALTTAGVVLVLLVERQFHPGLRRRDYLLLLLLALTTPLVAALGFPATSLPLVGILVGSFYGSALGATMVALLGIALPIGMEVGTAHLIATTIASLIGAAAAGRLRSREELALLGISVGAAQGIVYLLISLVSAPSAVWVGVLTAAGLQTLIGLAWSIVAMGISPYLEHLFDLVTPVRLAELSNPNRPLLKRLASEAPGTFQHTLFVASLAEAAARALKCNVELVRAGTLYHDIGKMHDALGFIENQMGGPNKHDLIDDPWRSACIIKKHVTEGLVMARKYRLPRAIQAFIPEHQGTMLIAYFYHAAQQRAQAAPCQPVKESDFRYDGPIPQSRETGIVMLADSCEAALRSLKDATPEEALAMVNRILRARWQDNQLDESGLTRAEMSTIADIFVKVWQQFNHQRIAYPKPMPLPQPTSAGS